MRESGDAAAIGSTAGNSAEHPPTIVGAGGQIPGRIGRYRIRRLIGAGGMGSVYEAVQEQPRRTVALKVMGSRMASPAAMRRFEYEAQVLGRLRHPGIAQVYEAGTHADTVTGVLVPYFAMEFVPGARTLTEYACLKGFNLNQRLDLFAQVCEAVQHGHHKGIIHRDLKPANVLVDSAGQVKVIDFGVARATDADMALATLEEQAGQLIGTVQYMSPEQCAADPHDIDVRSDVYSLGVVLYELLTGKLPYDLSGSSLIEATRAVQHQQPARLSTIDSSLRGDIETITLHALEKDRDRRYRSVAELADDIQRFLRDEPIKARRISALEWTQRWVRRNRALAGVLASAAGTLIVVSTVLIGQVVAARNEATRNLAEAQQNLRAARENFELVQSLFASMQPDQLKHGLVNVEGMLDKAAASLADRPPELAATEADFRGLLGRGYAGLGLYSKAILNLRRAADLHGALSPGPSAAHADALHHLAAALWWHGEYDSAEELYRLSLELRRMVHGEEHADVATSLTHLAACFLKQGRAQEAQELYTDALSMRRRLQGNQSAEVAASLNNLAKCVLELGHDVRAEDLFRRALTMISESVGESDLQTSHAMHNLALCLLEMRRTSEAAELFERALRIREDKNRPMHHQIASSRLGLVSARFQLAPDPALLLEAHRALHMLEMELPTGHPDITNGQTAVAQMLMELGRASDAEPLLRSVLATLASPRQPVATDLAEARARLGLCLAAQGRGTEAETLLAQGVVALGLTPEHRRLRVAAAGRLAEIYRARGDEARAAEYEAMSRGGF